MYLAERLKFSLRQGIRFSPDSVQDLGMDKAEAESDQRKEITTDKLY